MAFVASNITGGVVFAAPPASPAPRMDLAIEWVNFTRQAIASSPALSPGGTATEALQEALGPEQSWVLRTDDQRLSQALQRWCGLVGWQLVWEAERDFPVEVNIQLYDRFSSALERVMKSLQDSDYPLQAIMNAQTRVLRVRRQQESSR